mgnify:CR=1 FL=1
MARQSAQRAALAAAVVISCAPSIAFDHAVDPHAQRPGWRPAPASTPTHRPLAAVAPIAAADLRSLVAAEADGASPFPVAPRAGECYDLVIDFEQDPETGLTATAQLRVRDLDGDGVVRGDAGWYSLYAGPMEVESCVVTITRWAVLEEVHFNVTAFEPAYPFFYFEWAVGSSGLENWDIGGDPGVYTFGGLAIAHTTDAWFHDTRQGVGGVFPGYGVVSAPCQCAPTICEPGSITREDESDCGVVDGASDDSTNGGCNSQSQGYGFLTTPIEPGETLCGTAGTDTVARDTDWYRFTLVEPRAVTVRGSAAFELQLMILTPGTPEFCDGYGLAAATYVPACSTGEITAELQPGEYVIFVAPRFTEVPADCPSPYQIELIAEGWCDVPVCDPGSALLENEPDCDIPDDIANGGCDSLLQGHGFLTTPIALGDTACGTAMHAGGDRDADWYEFSLDAPTVVGFEARAEFSARMLVLQRDPDACPDAAILAEAVTDACLPTLISIALDPGDYIAMIAPASDVPVPCGADYQIRLSEIAFCIADINNDGSTNAADFVILAGNFGASVTPNTNGDLNGDGLVNAADFVILAGDFGCGN